MGLINCDVHGESGFMPFVSKELSDQILEGKKFKKNDLAQVDVVLIDEDDGEEMYTIQYIMTKECFLSRGLKREYEIRSEDDEKELDSIFDPIVKGGGVCGKCFKAAILD